MNGVFNIGQIVNARGLKDWTPTGGLNGADHEPIREREDMGNKWGSEIVAALQKHGPCSPAKLAEYVGVDRPAISHALAPMIKAKEVKVSGATISRMIALPGQDLPDAKPTAKKNVAAKKVHPQVAKVHSNTATSALTPPQSDLGIAINDQGELGLQRGDLRLALDASDVARLQRFLDCTKQFWAGA